MKTVVEILSVVTPLKWAVNNFGDSIVAGITSDSRQVRAGFIFVAVRGTAVDGHQFIAKAYESGATLVVLEDINAVILDKPFILVDNSAIALGKMAHHFYGDPSLHLQLVGITGTNGKTTTATLAYKLMQSLGYKTGLISTIENRINATVIPSTHTTPDPVQLNELLARMVADGCTHAFMEVSSHAAHQQRIAGLTFAGGVFTNITHDHLDYHNTFDNYIAAKKIFFDGLNKKAFALVNADDKRGSVMVQNCAAKKYRFSIKTTADFTARIKENSINGLVLYIDGTEFHAQLPGAFNALNLLTVYAIGTLLGLEKNTILTALSGLTPVEGRFDVVYSPVEKIAGVIDYAHTPDAVEKLLTTVRDMLNKDQHIISVVGCGGDRDRTKRPIMAKMAAMLSDKLIITSDNPRSEKPDAIIVEMEAGVPEELKMNCLSVADRKAAIKAAVMLAKKGDVICVAGKGHEKYQEIEGVKYPFDDKQMLSETFKTLLR